MSTPSDPDARRAEELKREREAELRARRGEGEVAGGSDAAERREGDAPAYDPSGVHPYDPDTKETDTTRPRSVHAMGSTGPTGVVPPHGDDAGPGWTRPAAIAAAILLILLLLLLLT